jgi:hypothetical protein
MVSELAELQCYSDFEIQTANNASLLLAVFFVKYRTDYYNNSIADVYVWPFIFRLEEYT